MKHVSSSWHIGALLRVAILVFFQKIIVNTFLQIPPYRERSLRLEAEDAGWSNQPLSVIYQLSGSACINELLIFIIFHLGKCDAYE